MVATPREQALDTLERSAKTRRGNKPALGSYDSLGYTAAQVLRTSGRPMPYGGSADYHARYDRALLVAQSQAFARDNGIYKGVIKRGVHNIIGRGFSLQARTASKAWNEKAEALWRQEFCPEPDIRGLQSWWQSECLVCESLWVDGDFGAVKLANDQLQMTEAERIATFRGVIAQVPNGDLIDQGVQMTPAGRPNYFWVADYNRFGQVLKSSARAIPAENFVFVANLERASQTRGMPALVCNFPMFHRVNDVCDSEAIAWQLLSRLAIAVLKKGATTSATQLTTGDAAQMPEPGAANGDPLAARVEDLARRIMEVDAGTIFFGEPDEDIKGIDRNIPGANFTASVTMFLRILGLPIGLPLELILLDWSKTNYSSARAALEQAFLMFGWWQHLLITRWHRPIYQWKIQRWIASGKLPDRADALKHEWITPSFPWLDQLKEAEAWGLRIDRGFSTHAEAIKSLNRDRGEWLLTRQAEVEEAIQIADVINKKYPGAKVDWRIFAGLLTQKEQTQPGGQSEVETGNGETAKAKDGENADQN
jgi:lambda family phage portal protein